MTDRSHIRGWWLGLAAWGGVAVVVAALAIVAPWITGHPAVKGVSSLWKALLPSFPVVLITAMYARRGRGR